VKQRQQKELAESLIAKVQKELENPKTLNLILQQSIADVESTFFVYLRKFAKFANAVLVGIIAKK
jgi:Mitochondrial ATP synthase B chain precursor (ATP-synt_B)